MAVLKPSMLLEEGVYEGVNHSRVLQPAFIRSKADRQALEVRVKEFQEAMRTNKRPNESVIYQKLLIERRSKSKLNTDLDSTQVVTGIKKEMEDTFVTESTLL